MALFPTTHWSQLAKASLGGKTEGRKALEDLCRRYWEPVHQFIRSRGVADPAAEDLTHEFMMQVLEKAFFARADPLQGRFRSFLLRALVKFLSHERDRRLAQKRGGSLPHVSAEALAETDGLCAPEPREGEVAAFDRSWALTIVNEVGLDPCIFTSMSRYFDAFIGDCRRIILVTGRLIPNFRRQE